MGLYFFQHAKNCIKINCLFKLVSRNLYLDSNDYFFFQKTKQLTAHGKSGQAVVPPVKEGSKIEELSNQPSMVERTAQDLKFRNVI